MWQIKMRLSGSENLAFPVKMDINHTALEAIWAAMFGTGETATITMRQVDLLSSMKQGTIPVSPDGGLDFPRADLVPAFDAILKLTDEFEGILKSPFPRIYGCESCLCCTTCSERLTLYP
jgi:hypothetical protein